MSDARRPRIVAIAASSYALYHVFAFAGAGLVLAFDQGERGWTTGRVVGTALTAALCCVPFGVSYELWRCRDWGRRWFTRWCTPELIAFVCVLELVERTGLTTLHYLGYGAGLAISALYVAWRVRLFFQLSSPEVRAHFTR